MSKRGPHTEIVRIVPDLGTGGLETIRDTFQDVRVDPYCETKSRYRAASRFDCSQTLTHGRLVVLPHAPLVATPEMTRDYPEMPRRLVDSPVLLRLVQVWLLAIPARLSTLTVHQIRTKAPSAALAEGKNKMGEEWAGIYVVSRNNLVATSGVTKVTNQAGDVLYDAAIAPGELVAFDERALVHEETGIEAAGPTGERDVLIFTSPDHAHAVKRSSKKSATPRIVAA
jgi:hypothetical protein